MHGRDPSDAYELHRAHLKRQRHLQSPLARGAAVAAAVCVVCPRIESWQVRSRTTAVDCSFAL
eukprot:6206230-Pleurochrysis_carterae.AAC.3